MLEKDVKIHDRFQFEMKLDYKIKKNKKKTSYDIDIYYFIPHNLGITPQSYSKIIFYKDIQSYIRFKTPTLLLRQIADLQVSPLSLLRKSIEVLIEKRDKPSAKDFEYYVKMVCSIINSALRDHADFITKNSIKDKQHLIDEFTKESAKIAGAYRNLKPLINVPTVSDKIRTIFRFGDEYISQNIDFYGCNLLKQLEQFTSPELTASKLKLMQLVKAESGYRVSRNYHVAPGDEKKEENEILIYRRGVLKKYIGSVLFLSTDIKPAGKFIEQSLVGIAAGLSMVFATVVAFLAQKKFGNLTFPLFAMLVVSYIFKDRIKELTRLYFLKKINKSLFDHKTGIFSDENQKIGVCKEAINFISENQLPDNIKTIRKKDHITEIENRWRGEEIILYRRQVHLYSRKLESVYKEFNIEGVNDIIRFNISRFLNKMDNPSKTIYTLKDDKVQIIDGKRIYHLNLIIKISREEKVQYQRVRLILSRNGIERIDQIEGA
jgi:hypothetical protein